MAARFDLHGADGSDDRHGFLVLADPQTQDAYEMGLFHAETVPTCSRPPPHLPADGFFGVGWRGHHVRRSDHVPRVRTSVSSMGMPFFQVVGNHDLDFGPSDDGSVRTFGRHFGPNFYSFDRGEVTTSCWTTCSGTARAISGT